jgi:hypothetical protein
MKGVEEARRELDKLSEAHEKYGIGVEQTNEQVKESSEQAAEGTAKQSEGMGQLALQAAKYVAGMIAAKKIVQEVTQAINEQSEAMKANAEVANRQQNSLLRLQFLGDFFEKHPNARAEVAAISEQARRPFEEVAGAWYNLSSKAGEMTEAQQKGILREAAETARQDPSVPMDTIIDMFAAYVKETRETDINRVQNVLFQTIEDAGGEAADTATFMPRFMGIGMKGGLSAPESAGLWAWATTREADPSVATTGIRGVMMSLQGDITPEGKRAMKKIGLRPGMTFDEQLDALALASASGKLTLPVAQQIAGERGANMLMMLAGDTANARRIMGNVADVNRPDIDLTREKIETVFGRDEIARMEENQRLLDNAIENLRGSDTRSMGVAEKRKALEYGLRKQETPEWAVQTVLKIYDVTSALGKDWQLREDLQDRGLLPEEYIPPQGGPTTIINNNANTNINERPPAAAPRTEGY